MLHSWPKSELGVLQWSQRWIYSAVWRIPQLSSQRQIIQNISSYWVWTDVKNKTVERVKSIRCWVMPLYYTRAIGKTSTANNNINDVYTKSREWIKFAVLPQSHIKRDCPEKFTISLPHPHGRVDQLHSAHICTPKTPPTHNTQTHTQRL